MSQEVKRDKTEDSSNGRTMNTIFPIWGKVVTAGMNGNKPIRSEARFVERNVRRTFSTPFLNFVAHKIYSKRQKRIFRQPWQR